MWDKIIAFPRELHVPGNTCTWYVAALVSRVWIVCSNKKWVDILVDLNCPRQRKGKIHVKLPEIEGLLIYQD